jgi:hypothetical protein
VSPSPADAIKDRLTGALGACTASEPVAVAMELGIRNEAVVRRALASAGYIGSALIGRTTTMVARRPPRSAILEGVVSHENGDTLTGVLTG